jgi:hypothetical protein
VGVNSVRGKSMFLTPIPTFPLMSRGDGIPWGKGEGVLFRRLQAAHGFIGDFEALTQ